MVCETSVLSGIENRNRRRNLDRGAYRACGQRGVDREDLSYGKRQVLVIDLAERRGAGNDLIVAGLKEVRSIETVAIGCQRARHARVRVRDHNCGVGNGCTRRICNSSHNVSVSGRLGHHRQNGTK